MIYALHLSLMLYVVGAVFPDAPTWAQCSLSVCVLLFYGVAILLWELHCKKVKELEREIEKLKNKNA